VRLLFTDDAWDDYQFWISNDLDVLNKLNRLIEDARHNLYKGIGKPEPLRGDLAGCWSRRITGEHRLVYRIVGTPNVNQQIEIIGCRYHYDD